MLLQSTYEAINERKLMIELIKIVSANWISASQFDRLASDLKITGDAETIYFLTGVRQILHELPIKVFTDESTRMAVLDAAQLAMDAAIEKEEAASAGESQGENT